MAKKLNGVRNRLIIRTAVGSQNGKPDYQEREFDLSQDNDVCAGGDPMSLPYLIQCISDHYKGLDNRFQDATSKGNVAAQKEILDENIAITLGKESLLLLLAQKDCEGLRFYFCKNPYGRNSVAAVGVRVRRDENGSVIPDEDGNPVAQDIGVNDDATSILTTKNLSEPLLNAEVGPPYTYAQLRTAEGGPARAFREDAFIKDLRNNLR